MTRIEIIVALVEAFNRGDVDGGLQHLDPNVELRPGVLAPDQRTVFRGHAGMKDLLLGATEPWESVAARRAVGLEEGPAI